MKRQPVITGLGIVSPIGVGVDKFWASALAGRSGITHPTLFDSSKLPPDCRLVGEVHDFNARQWMPGATARVAGRFSQFAVAAAKMAIADSQLSLAGRSASEVMVSVGSSMSGLVDVEHSNFLAFLHGEDMRPWTVLEYPGHAATSHVAISVGARGQTDSPATACVAGLDAISWAAEKVANAQASAVLAGANPIVAVDLNERKLGFAKQFGATHTINAGSTDPVSAILDMTGMRGVDYAFEVIGVPDVVMQAFMAVRRGGKAVIVGVPPAGAMVSVPGMLLPLAEKSIVGSLYGSANMTRDVPRLIDLYRVGKLKLDELITRTYQLDDINLGYDDMREGRNIRGVLNF